MSDENTRYNRVMLALAIIAVLLPMLSGFVLIYSDIQVLNNRVRTNEQKFQAFDRFVTERNPLTGLEVRTLFQELKNEVQRNRDMRLCVNNN